MSEGVSESRLNMWRAVVALVHIDNTVTSKERQFVENYLARVPFSPSQKQTLAEDLENPQDVSALFDKISDKANQSEFFEFARMIVWSDGDFDVQEEKIFEYLKDTQMFRLGGNNIQALLQETRNSQRLQNMREEAQFKQEAKDTVGIAAIFSKILPKRKAR